MMSATRAVARSAIVNVSWLFDVLSPFAYLSFKQLGRLPQNVHLEFVPILFGAVLNHHGQLGPAEMPTKRAFTYRFVLWKAGKRGIPLRFPPAHPFNPLAALRLIIAAGCDRRAVETVFDAVFLHGRDVADPAVVGALARELDIADPAAALADPAVKERLRANTEWAIARGVFGVPTFVIGQQLFWGDDAFDMALDYLHDPAGFQSAEMQKVEQLPVGVVRDRKR
jgi:2-hydroxychromene-2-carboxylate isomerase